MNTRTYEFKALDERKETEALIYDEIGGFGIRAAQFVADLARVPKDHRLILRIHSPGGSVLEGNAIINAAKAHPGGLTTHVDGLAASMAALLATAGAPARMASNAMLMIHNVASSCYGDAESLRSTADVVQKIQDGLVSVLTKRTGLSSERIAKMMDDETWLNATEAKQLGFVDDIMGDQEVKACFAVGFRHVPIQAKAFVIGRGLIPVDDKAALELANLRRERDDALAAKAQSERDLAEAETRIERRLREQAARHGEPLPPKDSTVGNFTSASHSGAMTREQFGRLTPQQQRAFCLNNGKITD